MATNAADVNSQSPTPSQGPEGTDLHSVARKVEGLLDDDGHYNPNPEQISRGHPDYVESDDSRANTPDRDDRGRFKKAAAADDTGDEQPEIKDDDETLDIPAAGDDSDEDTGEPGDTDEDLAASASDEATTDDEETGDDIDTLQGFAEALEMSIDDFKAAVTHTFNAADEEVTVTLQELEKGYQKDADYRRSTAKLANDRQLAEQEFFGRQQDYEQQNHFLASQLQVAENLVAAELNDPRLAELRESDPAEWTARRDEIGQRLGGLRNARIQAAQAYEQFNNTNQAQLRAREEAALLEAIPDFGKQHKADAKEILSGFGYSEHEISHIFDNRVIRGALELRALRAEVAELRQLKEQAGDTIKRVKKDIPKLTKPGKQRAKPRVKRDNVSRLRKRAKETGKVEDAARLIETLL
jgi:hypothetical protein